MAVARGDTAETGFSEATTRGEAQRRLARLFAEAGCESAALDARLLLCGALGVDHVALIRDPDLPLGAASARLSAFAARRLRHEPVSRILGHRDFWGLSFTVTPDVLDPRPDTETLVDRVLAMLGPRRHAPLTLVDLGTGSGAILAALLWECPAALGLGVDQSGAACRVARANLAALGLGRRSAILQGSWADAIGAPIDVVVSNPPYIESGTLPTLDAAVRAYDPPAALDGGPDGLAPYRALIPRLPRLLRPGGLAAFEIGSTQAEHVCGLMRDAGLADICVTRDLSGHDRVISGRTPEVQVS